MRGGGSSNSLVWTNIYCLPAGAILEDDDFRKLPFRWARWPFHLHGKTLPSQTIWSFSDLKFLWKNHFQCSICTIGLFVWLRPTFALKPFLRKDDPELPNNWKFDVRFWQLSTEFCLPPLLTKRCGRALKCRIQRLATRHFDMQQWAMRLLHGHQWSITETKSLQYTQIYPINTHYLRCIWGW